MEEVGGGGGSGMDGPSKNYPYSDTSNKSPMGTSRHPRRLATQPRDPQMPFLRWGGTAKRWVTKGLKMRDIE